MSMAQRHQLDLLDNAIDSLNEALAKYQQAKAGDVKAYKFCVLHLSHFLELVLKHYVTLAHPLLIYKNPFAKSFDGESQTIGLQEAINFLKNEGRELSDKFLEDLQWLKKLRNRIEHHKFDMDVAQVESTIGRLISAFVEFDQAHENLGFDDLIDLKQYNLFLDLADNYDLNLKKAENEVETACKINHDDSEFQVYHCDECGHDTLIPDQDSETGYRCTFCGNEESGDMEVRCGLCDMPWAKDLMRYLDWTDDGHYDYYCPRCLHDPEYVNDD
jgi:tetratricopeptide (TPR) repeat protein